jgi:hypothetical protein
MHGGEDEAPARPLLGGGGPGGARSRPGHGRARSRRVFSFAPRARHPSWDRGSWPARPEGTTRPPIVAAVGQSARPLPWLLFTLGKLRGGQTQSYFVYLQYVHLGIPRIDRPHHARQAPLAQPTIMVRARTRKENPCCCPACVRRSSRNSYMYSTAAAVGRTPQGEKGQAACWLAWRTEAAPCMRDAAAGRPAGASPANGGCGVHA